MKKSTIYIGLFAGLGILLSILITLLNDSLLSMGKSLEGTGGLGLLDAVLVLVLAIPISLVQTFILKDSIPASKIIPFIGASSLAGFLAGFVGGTAVNLFKIVPAPIPGIPIGALIGGVFGLISGFLQSQFMGKKEQTSKWLIYSAASNVFVWMLGWTVGWVVLGLTGAAISSALMMLLSGIFLSVFINTNHNEF